MKRIFWVGSVVATLLAGCGRPGPVAPSMQKSPDLSPSAAPEAPVPAPTPALAPYDTADLHVLDTKVNGDPTRIVYPTRELTPGQTYPALIFVHGYGMDQTQLTDRTELARAASAQGWISACGLLGGTAHWANDQALEDLGALIAELVAHHQADPKRIYLVGFSMGGGTALLAAENTLGLPYRVAAVVSTQGFTDLQAMTQRAAGGGRYAGSIAQAYGGQLTPAEATAHSPVDFAAKLKGIPVYLEHGEADTNVPDTHTIRMAQALTSLGIPYTEHLYPGLTHSEQTIHTDSILAFLMGKVAP
ncbi:MAG TPA: alpha/beta fold hydrolase [Oscillatoriaceae cyanobacterium]